MTETPRSLWARTTLHVWPERYRLVSLSTSHLAEAAALLSRGTGAFGTLILERDEVSLTLREDLWEASSLREAARAAQGPYRAITFALDLDLGVCGYLAPVAERLAGASISIVPQCGFLKDHILVREEQLSLAVETIEEWIQACRG
ncbi:MAG TPA: ACT domain-containing protein [Vicinamibacteria bacterium]|jgi:hypothetical protein|nr:ACT domain-containing protein [Vicinamibacteria bacterium]